MGMDGWRKGWKDLFSTIEAESIAEAIGPELARANAPANAFPAASSDPDWILVKLHIRERLIAQRRALETRGLSHSDTEGHRHAIFELEGVLNCLNPSKMQSSQSE
jgi:hypothetical protein